jgi:hypothetical protein
MGKDMRAVDHRKSDMMTGQKMRLLAQTGRAVFLGRHYVGLNSFF